MFSLNNATRLVLFILSLSLSHTTFSNTFFITDEKKASGYYNTETIRSERIKQLDAKQARHYSNKHKLIANHLTSHADSVAIEAKWDTAKILRVGVIRRSLANKDYATNICNITRSYGLSNENVSVKIIHLPSLLVYKRLELLIEHKCIDSKA